MTERISTQARLGDILSSLGEPTRFKIVQTLGSDQLSVTEIVEHLGISQPAASKHLKILREAGVIVMRPDAQRRLYRVSSDAFALLSSWSADLAARTTTLSMTPETEPVQHAPRRATTSTAVQKPAAIQALSEPPTGDQPVSAQPLDGQTHEPAEGHAAARPKNIPVLPRLTRFTRRLNGR
jgi:DNA-binding transcriptional ArsR family regulator